MMQIGIRFHDTVELPFEERLTEIKKQGFSFVGPTICYAFMQAVGMVNDHLVSCFRHNELGGKASGKNCHDF